MEIKELEHDLKKFKKISDFQSIPPDFLPKKLPKIHHPSEKDLNNQFAQEYSILFFTHLHKVVRINSLTLELKKARLKAITGKNSTNITEEPSTSRKRKLNIDTTPIKIQKTLDHFLDLGRRRTTDSS